MTDYQYRESRVQWPEHFTNGGSGITKFDPDQLALYERAIAESGDPDLFIKDNALHCKRSVYPQGLSPFWEVFRKLKSEQKANQ